MTVSHALTSPSSDAERYAIGLLLGLATLLFALVLASIAVSAPRANHDVAMYLHAGELLLEGQRPYVDFIDVNPPLITYLSAVAAAVARLLGLHTAKVFSLAVCVLGGWASWSVWRSLWRAGSGLAGALLACVPVGLGAYLWRDGSYGQREHLIVLLLLPYVVARVTVPTAAAASPARRDAMARFCRGFAAGIGVCLKPHYAALVLAVETFLCLARRDVHRMLAADIAGLLAAGALYALHFTLLPAEVRAALFDRWMPFLRQHYGAYETNNSLWTQEMTLTGVAAAIVAALRSRWRGGLADLATVFAVGAVVSIFIYLVQRKGWTYQEIPWRTFAVALAAVLVAACLEAIPAGVRAARLVVAAALVAVAWGTALSAFRDWDTPTRPLRGVPHNPFRGFVQRYSRPGEAILVVSTSVTPAYPILFEEGRRPGSRFLWLFPVPMFHQGAPSAGPNGFAYRDEAARSPEEKRFLAELREDLARTPPAMLIEPKGAGGQACPGGFHVAEYLRRAGALEPLASYQYVGETAGFAVLVPPERTAW